MGQGSGNSPVNYRRLEKPVKAILTDAVRPVADPSFYRIGIDPSNYRRSFHANDRRYTVENDLNN